MLKKEKDKKDSKEKRRKESAFNVKLMKEDLPAKPLSVRECKEKLNRHARGKKPKSLLPVRERLSAEREKLKRL